MPGKAYLIDMGGVLVRGSQPVPGANKLIGRLRERGARFLVLTNYPIYTPRVLAARLGRIGLRGDRRPSGLALAA